MALYLVTALFDFPLFLVLYELLDVLHENTALNLIVLLHILLHSFHLILKDQLRVLLLLGAQLLDFREFSLVVLIHVLFAL